MLLFFGSEFLTTLAGDYGFLYSIACLALNYNSYYALSKSFCDFSDSFLSSASLITYNGITFDLRTSYNLPVVNAIKQDKDGAIDMLQEDVRKGRLRIQKDSPFDEECKSIVWERDENDVIRRVVDDNAFHPDVADAVLYSLRPCWQCFN